ncbi:autoinducer binding domain-containing protein, partial [Aphanothece microscopica]|uniref:autoinducer binding domain-containing protein n=1 Tax=Aphanothece microscopica TaxID=1049561 RepID=UPI0039850E26
MAVLELLGRIAQERTVDAVWALAADHFAGLGFSRLNYGLTRYRTETSIGDPDDALYLTTTDAAYRSFYFRDGFYARTPVWRWITHNTGATTWRWVEEDLRAGRLSADEAAAVRQNAAMGVVAGIAISFPETTQRTKGALGLIADVGLGHDAVDEIWARNSTAIMAVANMMHLKLASLPAR